MTVEPTSPQTGRSSELQGILNRRVFHPLAMALALRLPNTFVTPNQLSVAGCFCIVAAGAIYVQPFWPWSALAGLAVHLLWHVFDGADGDLARLTGRSNASGEFVDGVCDYLGHIVLYLTLAWMLQGTMGAWALPMAVLSGVSRIVQQNYYETNRRQYQWWMNGMPWLGQGAADSADPVTENGFVRLYVALSRRVAMHSSTIDTRLAATARRPDRQAEVREALRSEILPFVRGQYLLGANPRTIALGGAMLAGSPIYLFLFETIALNLVLAISRYRLPQVLRGAVSSADQVAARTSR